MRHLCWLWAVLPAVSTSAHLHISPSASRESPRPRQCQFLVELVRLQITGSQPLTLMPQQIWGCKVKELTSILEGLRHWNLLLFRGSSVSRTRSRAAFCSSDYANKPDYARFLTMTKTQFKCLEGKGNAFWSLVLIWSISNHDPRLHFVSKPPPTAAAL